MFVLSKSRSLDLTAVASGKLKVDTHKAGECLLFSYLLK